MVFKDRVVFFLNEADDIYKMYTNKTFSVLVFFLGIINGDEDI